MLVKMHRVTAVRKFGQNSFACVIFDFVLTGGGPRGRGGSVFQVRGKTSFALVCFVGGASD